MTALKEEAIFVSKNYNWSSFISVLALCNVIKVYIYIHGQCSNLDVESTTELTEIMTK